LTIKKGANSTRIRVLNYLHSLDEPQTAHDISFNLNLSKRKVVGQLRILVNQKKIVSKQPLKHLGERFPSIYWFKPIPLRFDNE
jgi:hypothetical protein